jgi:tetratricopeptide (TPR) repeat protein
MKTMKTALVLGALLVAGAGAAAAQTDAVAGAETGGATTLIDAAQAAAQLARADELMGAGRLAEARTVLVALVDQQKIANFSSAEALLKLAGVEHAQGRSNRAAAALDDAATEAEVHHQPALQARALLDAAATYAGLRQHDKAQSRLQRLAPLTASATLPAELKAEIEARVKH